MGGEQHDIVIDGINGSWRRTVDRRKFSQYSRRIHERIEADVEQEQQESRIDVPQGIDRGTLERLVEWIDRGLPNQYDLTFHKLLRLSIAIWEYGCDPSYFARLAPPMPDGELGADAAGWMFIEFVFGGERDFKPASRRLIESFSSRLDVVKDGQYLPPRLGAAVVTARRQLLEKTFRFVRDDMMKYARSGGQVFSYICQKLYANGIDIALPEHEFVRLYLSDPVRVGAEQHRPCPVDILDTLERILLATPQEGRPVDQEPVQEVIAGSSSSGSVRENSSGMETQPLAMSDLGERADDISNRGDIGVNGGRLRRFIWSHMSRNKKGREECKDTPRWEQRDVRYFEYVASELRGRIESRRLELFGGCGLDLRDFQDLRRRQMLIPRTLPAS